MKIAVCFVAVVSCALALPAEIPFEAPDELDLSKLVLNNVYVEPVHHVKIENVPGSRIIGGAELVPNSVPYQVAVIINGNSLCGGSLISNTRVLSAAHCTISAAFAQIRLGAHRFNENEDTQVRITSNSIINHENYDGIRFANDISVILLPSVAPINDYIKVVPLAAAGAPTYEGEWGLLAGWGPSTDAANIISPALRGVHLNIISNLVCRGIYGDVVQNSNLCTSGTGIVGGCNGDTGGPLVVDGVQVGIGSFQSTKCESGNPTGFTRISSYRYWIVENAGV